MQTHGSDSLMKVYAPHQAMIKSDESCTISRHHYIGLHTNGRISL